MQRKRLLNSRARLAAILALGLSACLGGCNDYLKRRDTVTLSAGEDQSWNRVVHVADPWPRAAANTRIEGDGQRVSRAMERYKAGDVAAVVPAQTATPAEKPANGAQPTPVQPQ